MRLVDAGKHRATPRLPTYSLRLLQVLVLLALFLLFDVGAVTAVSL